MKSQSSFNQNNRSVDKWSQSTLGDTLKLKSGKFLNAASMDSEGGFPVYGGNGIAGHHNEYMFDQRMIVIGRVGVHCGAVYYTHPKSWITDNALYVAQKDSRLIDEYLKFALQHAKLNQYASSFGQPLISATRLKDVPIPIPPTMEQKRIAAILVTADRLRRMRRYALEVSEGFLQSVFLEMFGDPVANPMGWPLCEFGSIGTLDRGRSRHRPRNAPELLDGPYPLIQTGDVANSGGYIESHTQSYSELGLAQSKIWPEGTLCITIAANIAKTGILTFDACFPDSVVGYAPRENANVAYIQTWLSFIQAILEATAPQVAQKNINLEILRNLAVPLPPLDLQEEFTIVVAKHRQMTRQQQEAIRQTDHLFETLLHRAFRGEL